MLRKFIYVCLLVLAVCSMVCLIVDEPGGFFLWLLGNVHVICARSFITAQGAFEWSFVVFKTVDWDFPPAYSLPNKDWGNGVICLGG